MQSLLSDEFTRIQDSLENEARSSFPSHPIESSGIAIVQGPAAVSDEQQTSDRISSPLPSVAVANFLEGTRRSLSLDAYVPTQSRRPTYVFPVNQLTTPQVQRVVVEHIIKGNDIVSSHNSSKLRFFSGRLPTSSHEVDYETWRNHTEFLLSDLGVAPRQVTRKIVENLLPPAANIIKHLGPHADVKTYLHILDSAYSTVEDGDELFVKFLSTHQDVGERTSAYLSRLQTALNLVVRRGGIVTNDFDR